MNATERFESLEAVLGGRDGVIPGKLYGKRCLRVGGRAFMAPHLEAVVFKLRAPSHADGLAAERARPWDLSGKGRTMTEWVAIPADAATDSGRFAEAVRTYVGGWGRHLRPSSRAISAARSASGSPTRARAVLGSSAAARNGPLSRSSLVHGGASHR